jgi:hypothetical protein
VGIGIIGAIIGAKDFLTDEQRKLLQRKYKQIKDKQLAVRMLCVLALDSGYTYQQIREILSWITQS